MKRVLTEGPRNGKCNICGELCVFTQDHVPPKGSVNPRKVGIKSFVQTIEPANPKIVRLSQNGVKFRSICRKCNNELLGAELDPALNQFSQKLAEIIRDSRYLTLPPKISISLQPQKVARSVIGHLLAAEIRDNMSEPPRSAPMVDAMRQYCLDSSADLPTDLNLYFWTYPAKRQVILRGVGLVSVDQVVIGDFLKYFPVAFWLTHETPDKIRRAMQDCEIPVRGCEIEEWRTVDVITNRQNTLRPDWPEAPNDTEVLLINDAMCFIAEARQ